MRVAIEQLSDHAHVWIFGISPALDAAKSDRVLEQVDGFLESWHAHNVPITGARDLVEGSFLVVAADEGVMPQTREHLAILDLLGVSRGVVALTKSDLVDKDWCDLVAADVEAKNFVLGTVLDDRGEDRLEVARVD